ncbi:MAG: histidine phosphatase family protein [Bacteroidales bacterium]|nr:histidine phosphatase family protein [Bacteroidales bacterium]
MKLILVRHGETIENSNGICQGQREGRLSKKGKIQVELTALQFEDISLDVCFTSDLKRAVETAEVIANKSGLRVIEEPALRERNLGELQGRAFPKEWDLFNNYEKAERIDDIFYRLKPFVNVIERLPKESTILIVSHGITLRILLALLLKKARREEIRSLGELANCSITILERVESGLFRVIEYNNTNHLNKQCL